MALDISFETFVANFRTDWFIFVGVFMITFALVYISLVKFFTKTIWPDKVNSEYKKTHNPEKVIVQNKEFVIMIAAIIGLFVGAAALQTKFFSILDNSYGFVLGVGIILIVYTLLLIPIYKFLDMKIENRVISNIIVVFFFWLSFFLIRSNTEAFLNLPPQWYDIVAIASGVPMLIIGLIVAFILGKVIKRRQPVAAQNT